MLQGSLDNFALDEVLGLLAGTSKTGQLDIGGDRGTGSLVFNEGKLIDGTASHIANGTQLEDVMFELLRYEDGTFNFDSREVPASEVNENVATVLASAENRLRDWRSIEAVVPTLNHQVTPAEDLPADEVTISRVEWAALTVIAAGCPVSLVCERLQLGEVEGSRQIKNLAERQLVAVGDPLGSFGAVTRATQITTDSRPTGFDAAVSGDSEIPPAPPAPTAADLGIDDSISEGSVPPAPPSPAEISEFGTEVEDASELLDGPLAEGADGDDVEADDNGLLMRYLKDED